jgi:hypothetical protein
MTCINIPEIRPLPLPSLKERVIELRVNEFSFK